MNRPVDESLEATPQTTVLDRVRPTVVVRRRVYEPPQPPQPPQAKVAHVGASAPDEDDESGPPSSVNVARALASLRADELHRLEKILSDNDDEEEDARLEGEDAGDEDAEDEDEDEGEGHDEAPRAPTVKVGPSISVAELARRMGAPVQEVVTSLVTRGFFSVTVKSSVPRDTARAAAALFGFQIEETDEVVEEAPERARAKNVVPKARGSAPAGARAKSKLAPGPKGKAHVKPAKKKTGTRAR